MTKTLKNLLNNLEYLGPGDYIAVVRNQDIGGASVIVGPRHEFDLYPKVDYSAYELLFKEWLDDGNKS